MIPPDATTGRDALAEQRRELARARDKDLQNLQIMQEYAQEGRRSRDDVTEAAAEAEAACQAVTAFDAMHPHIRTTGNAEDDAQALRGLQRLTGA
ncbi:hypothetical protein AB0D14_35935 [Streptomyces sp. NPDC048484]|uniref:hypothetical protein n=1 Tax=Streptomyces sp. NPDC048484 TaxID=3155146 RepID=UPI0034489C8F